MSEREKTITELFDEGTAIDEALRLAARDARRVHKAMGNPMAAWQDGRVVLVKAEDIVVDPDEDDRVKEGRNSVMSEQMEQDLAPIVRQLLQVMKRLERGAQTVEWSYLDTAMFAIQRCLDAGGPLMRELRDVRETRTE